PDFAEVLQANLPPRVRLNAAVQDGAEHDGDDPRGPVACQGEAKELGHRRSLSGGELPVRRLLLITLSGRGVPGYSRPVQSLAASAAVGAGGRCMSRPRPRRTSQATMRTASAARLPRTMSHQGLRKRASNSRQTRWF